MATNIRPLPPPLSERMIDDTGHVTRAWGAFFTNIYRHQQAIAEAVEDDTYTVGLGSTDGTITITDGVITAIQEVVS